MAKANVSMAQAVLDINNWEFCDLCKAEQRVKWKCIQCLQHLCERCKIAHIYGKITMEHRLITKEEKDDEAELLRMYKCETHTDENVSVYCENDRQPVCILCIEDDHRGHTFKSLGKVADDIRNEIKEIKENRKIIKKNLCPVQQIYKSQREVLETKREIEKDIVAFANEMMNVYCRKYQAIEQEYMQFKLDTSARILCSDDDHDMTNLRDVEIIRKSNGVHGSLKPQSKDGDGHSSKLSPVPDIHRAELRKAMLQRLMGNIDRTPIVRGDRKANHYMAEVVACIYVGICKTFIGFDLKSCTEDTQLSLKEIHPSSTLNSTGKPCILVDDFSNVTDLRHGKVEEYKNYEGSRNHIIFLGPGIVEDGNLSFVSEDGVQFNGGDLLRSLVRYLKQRLLSVAKPRIDAKNTFWQIVLSEAWSGQMNDLAFKIASDFTSSNLNVHVCSDSDACIMYWSKCVPKSVNMKESPCIILEMGEYIGISTRIVQKDGECTPVIKSAICPGYLEIVHEWANIINRLTGRTPCLQFLQNLTFDLMEKFDTFLRLGKGDMSFSNRDTLFVQDFIELVDLLKKPLTRSVFSDHMSVKRESLVIQRSFIACQVKEIIGNVCKHISQVLSMPQMSSATTILLFGKFSSEFVAKELLETTFPRLSILNSDKSYDDICIGGAHMGWKKH